MSTGPERWVRPEIQALEAYRVADAEGLIKLDAMENPYPFPVELTDGWLDTLRHLPLNRYPDPSGRRVRSRLRGQLGLGAGQDLILGNGSDELIQMIVMALGRPGAVVLSPAPSFVMYRMIAVFAGVQYVEVPLASDDFSLDLEAMHTAIEEHRPAVIFLACPNNPTGNLWPQEHIERILQRAPGLVVVDEAYAPFASETLMDRLGDWPNLVVMRTLSKMGLAGLRLGYLAGPREWLRELDKIRLPYNINVLTQASVDFALAHADALSLQAAQIVRDRAWLYQALDRLPRVRPFPSEANFILFRVPEGRAGSVYQALRDYGVLVKAFSGGGVLEDMLRVTVGTSEENRRFIDALQMALSAL